MKHSITPEKEIRAIKGLLLELSGRKVVEKSNDQKLELMFPNRAGVHIARVIEFGDNRDQIKLDAYRDLLCVATEVHARTKGGLPAFFERTDKLIPVYEAQ